MRFFILFFILVFIAESYEAAKISGTAVGFENKYLRLYKVDDFISYSEIKMDVVKIGPEGKFELNAHLPKPSVIKLCIEDKRAELIYLPDTELILALSYDEEENVNKLFDKQLKLTIKENSDFGINKLVWEYQTENAAFLEENHSKLVTKNILPAVYEFQNQMNDKYRSAMPFFRTYLEYSLASLEDAVLGSEKKLFQHHISGRPTLYYNVAYMNFFSQFYSERFIGISQGKDGFQLLSAVNGSQNYDKMMEIILKHEFINNDTLAQLFAILGLNEVYGDETFKKPKVISMLKTLKSKALNSEIERICSNVLKNIIFLGKGETAPDFSLRDMNSDIHHLSDKKGKTVLIFFWSAYSNESLRDLLLLNEYHEKYLNKIHILAINMDEDPAKAKKFVRESNLTYTILFKDAQYDLTDKYKTYGGRTFALIDRRGNIYAYPAKLPEENLESDIFILVSEN